MKRQDFMAIVVGVVAVLGFEAGLMPTGAAAANKSKCTQKKITAAGKKVSSKAACASKAASKGIAVDTKCLDKAEAAFAKAFTAAEKSTDCLATAGDTASVETRVDAFLDDLVCDLGADCPQATTVSDPLRVLVTNDDGVAAPGIDAVVTKLATNTNLDITVIAPGTNQSGTGDNTTTTNITVTTTTTLSGFPAKAVNGFPADTTLFGILQGMSPPPDLIVSGINFGQNISAEIVPISGTVGAGLWAARKGIPAIAVSQGLGASLNYTEAANYVATVVERFRTNQGFRNKMREGRAPYHGVVLNVNFPTCTSGTTRGVRVVPLGRGSQITGYTLVSDLSGTQTWHPVVQTLDIFASNCASTLTTPTSDVEAMNNGFASLTPLGIDLTASGRLVSEFAFLEQ